MGFLSKIFDPGRKDRRAAADAAAQGVIKGFNFSGPGGIGGSFNFRGGQGSSSTSLGVFEPMLQNLMQTSMGRLGQTGTPDALNQLAAGTIDRLGLNTTEQISGRGDYDRLGGVMEQNLALSQRDPFDLGSTISDKLRQLSERKNQRLVNKMFDRLQSTGNLTSSAGIQRAGDMERNLFEQGLQFDLAGLQAGESMISNAFNRGMGALQGRESIAGRTFGESFAQEQMLGQRAMDQYGVGSSLFGLGLEADRLNSGIGLQQLQAALGIQNLPLQQMLGMGQLTGLASGSNFNRASVLQGNAAMATSPFLEALNAAGQFASNISGFKMPGT